TGTGEVVTCSPTQNVDLFRGLPNSYGSLGYAVRLKIELEKVKDYVELRHVRFHDVHALTETMEQIVETGEHDGEAVDYLDGAVFSLEECYLMLGRQTDEPGPTSDYTRDRIYYRSIQHPEGVLRDRLSIRDYLWRWDVDWFWASRAFGTQNPTIRHMWPRDLLRSSFYWQIIGWDRKYDLADRIEAANNRPARERVVQDIEVTPEHLPGLHAWFLHPCEMEPAWLCPIRIRGTGPDASEPEEATSSSRRRSAPLAGTSPSTPRPSTTGRPSSSSTAAASRPSSRKSTTRRGASPGCTKRPWTGPSGTPDTAPSQGRLGRVDV